MKKLVLLGVCLNIIIPAWAGLRVDALYWRLSGAESSFDEKISESDIRNDLGNFNIKTADIQSGRPVWGVETDASKYLFNISYRFDEWLHRLTLGFQYAGTGNSEVSKASWIEQGEDMAELLTDLDFSANRLVYTNFYASYRLFPLESNQYAENSVQNKGVDLWVTWTSLEQEYTVKRATNKQYSVLSGETEASRYRVIEIDFSTDVKSLGLGIGGTTQSEQGFWGLEGRLIYLPFFDFPGQGWDAELMVTWKIMDRVTLIAGGKWLSLEVETEETIKNIAQLPGFSDSEATFKGLSTDISGYVLGVRVEF